MTTWGYIRTSKTLQDGQPGMKPETQHLQLQDAGVDLEHIYRDLGVSGSTSTTSRRGWMQLHGRLKAGDVLVVVELARIGRRWTETVNSVRQLREQGIRIRSLAQAEQEWTRYLDADEDAPDYFIGSLLLLVSSWCAGQELEAIRRRTRAGLDRARAKGVKLGRPWAGPPAMRDLAVRMRQDGASHGEIAKSLNQPRSTVRSWLRREQASDDGTTQRGDTQWNPAMN